MRSSSASSGSCRISIDWIIRGASFMRCSSLVCMEVSKRMLLHLLSSAQGVAQGAAIDVFQGGAAGQSARQSGDADIQRGQPAADFNHNNIAFERRIGGQNDLGNAATADACGELLDGQIFRAYAVNGGQVALEHMVKSAI